MVNEISLAARTENLHGKVSLLIAMSVAASVIFIAGVVYTFSGITDFKTIYHTDCMELNTKLAKMNEKNLVLIQKSITSLTNSLDNKFLARDNRLTKLEIEIASLEDS